MAVNALSQSTKFDDPCRLCATKTESFRFVHIFDGPDKDLSKKIGNCLQIRVHQEDELPKTICQDCFCKLEMFWTFKNKSIKTEQELCEIYKVKMLNAGSNMEILLEVPHQLLHESLPDVSNMDISDLVPRDNADNYSLILSNQNEIHANSLQHLHINTSNLNAQNLSNETMHIHQNNIPIIQTHAAQDYQDDNLNFVLREHFPLANDIKFISHLTEGSSIFTESAKHFLSTTQDDTYTKKVLDYSNLKNSLPVDSSLSDNSLEKHLNRMIYSHDNLLQDDNNGNPNLLVDQEISNVSAVIGKNGDYLLDENNDHREDLDLSAYICNLCEKSLDGSASLMAHCENHLLRIKLEHDLNTRHSLLNNSNKKVEEQKNYLPTPIRSHHGLVQNFVSNDSDVKSWENDDSNNLDDTSSEDGLDMNLKNTEINCNSRKQQIEHSDGKKGQGQQQQQLKKKKPTKQCTECGKSYSSNYKLSEHMRKHTGERPFKCKSCDKTFRSKIGLSQHETKHTGKFEYLCSTCGKGFQCRSYLQVHQRAHSNLKPFPCSTCGQNFKSKQSLLDHTNRHLGLKPFACSKCDKRFATKALVQGHEQTHKGVDNRRYSCKTCDKRFVSKSYLRTHSRIHTGEKPFICEVCNKGFITRVDLKIHSTMHTGEKKYVCEMCGKPFARLDALKCHTRSHTGERPYSCEICGKTFTQFTPMANHRRYHTGEKPYKCDTCGQQFVTRSTMLTHTKKHQNKSTEILMKSGVVDPGL